MTPTARKIFSIQFQKTSLSQHANLTFMREKSFVRYIKVLDISVEDILEMCLKTTYFAEN